MGEQRPVKPMEEGSIPSLSAKIMNMKKETDEGEEIKCSAHLNGKDTRFSILAYGFDTRAEY